MNKERQAALPIHERWYVVNNRFCAIRLRSGGLRHMRLFGHAVIFRTYNGSPRWHLMAPGLTLGWWPSDRRLGGHALELTLIRWHIR